MEALLGVREAARVIGVSHSTISRQLSDGVFANHGTAARPLLRLSEVKAGRAEGLDHSKRRAAAPPPDLLDDEDGDEDQSPAAPTADRKVSEGRALNLDRDAEFKLIRNEEKKGLLCSKRDVEDGAEEAGQALREALVSRTRELADRLASMTDPVAIASLLAESDAALLEQIADALERRIQSDAA